MSLSSRQPFYALAVFVGCVLTRLTMPAPTASADEPIFARNAELRIEAQNGSGGEGPVWHQQLGLLSSGNGDIYQLDRQGHSRIYRQGAGANGLLFDRQGRLLVCEAERRRVTRIELNGKVTVLTDRYEGRRYNQPNDLALDSQGRIYFTDPRYGSREGMEIVDQQGRTIEGVYRIDVDGKVTRILGRELERPNGILVSADDRFLFVADNNNDTLGGARKLWRFALSASGTIDVDSRKLVYDWGNGRGPDGIKQDQAGRLYVAAGLNKPNPPFEPADDRRGGIYVIDPDGKLLDFLPVPRDEVTNCAFGGEDLKTLYITAGGTLYSIRTTTAGQVARPTSEANGKQSGSQPAAELTNSIGMKLVLIPAGEFLMGSADSDPGARDDEQPQHRVRISKPFYLGAYEVTQGEFEAVMGEKPSSFTRAGLLKDAPAGLDVSRLPADNVSWPAAVEFCLRLSNRPAERQAGRLYRLPTEAEWEYACRAGTTTAFHFGETLSSMQANFNGQNPFGDVPPGPFLNRTTTVGSYKPNAFGLYDMHGNLNEWCLDRFGRDYYQHSPADDPRGPEQGTYRVIRGGDWYSDGRDCRSAFRYADVPAGRFYALGMRVVCELASWGATPDPVVAASGRGLDQPAITAAGSQLTGRPDPMSGEDWPQWRGPRGDGTWRGPKLPPGWPKDGLQRVWRHQLSGGYGGVAVTAGRAYVMDRQREPEDVERVLAFDAAGGELLWSHSYPADYRGVEYGNGPRATPTVFQGRVYTLGAVGRLLCLDAVTGDVVWSKDLVGQCGARVPPWGLSASPVVFENLLIVHAGAEPDGSLIALDGRTGEERWRSLPDPAGYATPILIRHQGTPQLVAWTPTHVRGLAPATGELLWSVPFVVNYGTSIASPIFRDGLVLVSSYYDGSLAIRPGDGSQPAEVAWRDRRNLRGLMMQPLYRDRHAYLLDKRHGLTCFELATGKKLWDDDNRLTPKGRNPQATLVWLGDDDRAIGLNSDGELILLRLRPEGYLEESRTKVIGPTWAHPAYAGNCVYARNDSEIVCVLLPPQPDS